MRIWDVHPGYLNRESLLGEHRELHAIVSILVHRKRGYSRHPETLRWTGHGWALRQRHRLLAAEMALRGYTERSPVTTRARKSVWPETYVDDPQRQFQILAKKYLDKEVGRIPLPRSARQLWNHHQYSVLARDPGLYTNLERRIGGTNPPWEFPSLETMLVGFLRRPPSPDGIKRALGEMWSLASGDGRPRAMNMKELSFRQYLIEIQERALEGGNPKLTASTALSDLMAWIPVRPA